PTAIRSVTNPSGLTASSGSGQIVKSSSDNNPAWAVDSRPTSPNWPYYSNGHDNYGVSSATSAWIWDGPSFASYGALVALGQPWQVGTSQVASAVFFTDFVMLGSYCIATVNWTDFSTGCWVARFGPGGGVKPVVSDDNYYIIDAKPGYAPHWKNTPVPFQLFL